MKYFLVFFLLITSLFASPSYEILYNQRSTNTTGDFITGFFNIFEPSMDKGNGTASEYSFEYFRPTDDTRFAKPYLNIQSTYRYYKFYVPEGLTDLDISGVSHLSNTEYEIYLSYSHNIDFANAIDIGTGGNGMRMDLLTQSNNPTLKMAYNQSSYLAEDASGTPRVGWIYLAIKGTPRTSTDPMVNTFNISYRFKVNKTAYNNWLSTVGRDGSNPIDPNAEAVAPTISTVNAPSGLATIPYELQLSASGTTPITWTLPTKPGDMSINSSGLITWANPTQGTHTVIANAQNSAGSDAEEFTISIGAEPLTPVINPISFNDVEVNTTFSGTVTLSQGTGPITWSLSGQPSGMAINSSGVISWSPASPLGDYNITVTASNDYDQSDSETFALSVVEPIPPVLVDIPDQNYTEAIAYSYEVTTSAGSTPMDWNLTGAPENMSISDTGTISWSSPVIGDYPITVGVSNGGGYDTETFTLSIVPPVAPDIDPIDKQTAEAYYYYSYDINTSAGSDPISWSIISPSPSGNYANLAIDQTGRLTWDYPTIGSHSFLIQASNAAGNVIAVFELDVTEPVAPTFNPEIPDFIISSARPWSYDANASGSGDIEWYASKFPQGLQLNQTSGLLSWDEPTPGIHNTFSIYIVNTSTGDYNVTSPQITVLAPPAISTISNQTIPTSLDYEFNATLSNTSEAGDVNWTISGDSGAAIDMNSGTITWASVFAEGNYTINIFANNGLDEGNTTFGLEALPPEYLIIDPIADQRIQTGRSLDITATAKGFGTITWSIADANGSGVDINATTGQITLNNALEGQYAITIQADSTGDGSTGGTDTEDFNLSVTSGGINPSILMYLLN